MKYTLVYRDHPQGYCWTVRNNYGLYAAAERGVPDNGKYTVRSWRTAGAAGIYMQVYIDSTCIWKPWPDEKPASIKPVTTAASYKPAHGGYPQPLVWPVIPQANDGSNEEASTVSEALVQALAQRVFVIRIRNALKGY